MRYNDDSYLAVTEGVMNGRLILIILMDSANGDEAGNSFLRRADLTC